VSSQAKISERDFVINGNHYITIKEGFMKRSISLLFMGVLIMCGIMPPLSIQTARAEETVTVGFGSLKLGGLYQASFTYYEDENLANQFKLIRARLSLTGVLIPDKVKFFVQGDGTGSPYILDSKLSLFYIPMTELVIGRFSPNFTLFWPRSSAKQDLVNYPLTTSKYGPGRQTGMQSTTKTKFVDITAGVFNGYQTKAGSSALDGNDWGDNNDAKDFLVCAEIKPMDKLKFSLFGWFGKPYNYEADEDFDATRLGVNAEWYKGGLHLAGEYIAASTDYVGTDSVDSMAYFAQGSYAFNANWELLGRYDYYDANTDLDDDAINWLTGGVNFSLADFNTKFFLNYIMKDEEGAEIDNDEFVVMAQYAF
jgi:hypothetical protein